MKRQHYIRKQKRRRLSKRVALFAVAILSALAVGFVSLRIYAQIAGAPTITVPKATVFLDQHNNQIGDYFQSERRYWLDLDKMSPYLREATVAIEDKDFYEHGGFDYSRIAGALLADLKAGRKVQGASTLTQQYARNLYLTHEKTWMRKINEALYAYRLEVFYSKDEILEGYLNTVYYGHGMYGAEAASRYYFGKSAGDLTLAEAAMLAGIPKGPTYYSPIANIEKAAARQELILAVMADQNKITAEEKTRAVKEQLVYKNSDWVASKSIAPYFLDVVWTEASEILEKQNMNISEGGWTIQTTLNMAHQQAAEEAVAKNMPKTELQAALVSMDVEKGFVTALVGGRDYSTSSYNRVTTAERQPGSTIKPILYAAALEDGFTPLTALDVGETIFTYDDGRATYKPQNVNGQFASHPMSLAQALAISDNIYAVKTLEKVGYSAFQEMLQRFDLKYSKKSNPSVALGTVETSLYDLTNAYNTIAAQGQKRTATTIMSITDAKGKVVYKYSPPKAVNVLSAQDAFLLTHMMTGIFDPVFSDYSPATGVSLRSRMTQTYAAKSGTTLSDQWLIGYTPRITAGVWNGYDQGKTLEAQEDMAATKQVWIDFMESVHAGEKSKEFPVPDGVQGAIVDIESGKLAMDACPKQRLVYLKEADVPVEKCRSFDILEPDTWKNFGDFFDFEVFHNFWRN